MTIFFRYIDRASAVENLFEFFLWEMNLSQYGLRFLPIGIFDAEHTD